MVKEGERRAVFLITPPPSLTLWARLRRALFPNRDLEHAIDEGETHLEALQHGYQVARRATELLSFQAAQLEAEQQQVRRGEDAARRTAELLSLQSARLETREKELRQGDEVARRAADLLSVQTARLAAEQRERAQAEERLLEAQQLETLGRVAVTAAPDVDRAFTGIVDDLEAALERLEPDHPVRSALDGIRAAADRGAALVRRLAAIGGPDYGEPERVVLDELLLSFEPMLREVLPAAIQIAVLPASGPLEVVVDPGQLRQAVLALALNARDAMPEGGRLEIHLCRADRAEAGAAGVVGSGDFARIEVRDTGRGMDAETLAKALDPFYTTRAPGEGSGLGLAAVRAIVQRAGGALQLESEPGKGSLVVILLPLAP
jgi:signal transduction histidine kinase